MDIIEILSQAVDEDGVRLNIDLTPKTYLYLALTGVVIFASGALVWHLIAKKL